MELITPHLRIREFYEGDFRALREMDTRPEFNTYERGSVSEAETQKSLDESITSQHETPRTVFWLAITIPPEETAVGTIKLSRNQETIREWEVGWAIRPDKWGKGYATEAASHIMDWGFRELNIHRIVAFCHVSNAASVRVMEKLGMQQDGKLRESRWLKGRWWDEYVYSILEREWEENKNPTGL
jgi:RimJ/RimL family protein N-acetyltransferase